MTLGSFLAAEFQSGKTGRRTERERASILSLTSALHEFGVTLVLYIISFTG